MLNNKEVFHAQLLDASYRQLKFFSLVSIASAFLLAFIVFRYVNGIALGVWIEFIFRTAHNGWKKVLQSV